MKKVFFYIVPLYCVLALSACSSDDDGTTGRDEGPARLATVTLMATPNGLGDNGYNDAAAEGVFAFAKETGTRLRLLLPKDETEAQTMYRQWLSENAAQDSAVLILGSSVYEDMAKSIHNSQFIMHNSGSRVLLFESDAEIDGVSTVIISRYGVSWLAGAMSQGFDALVLTATPGITLLEESIAGFQEARAVYGGEFEDRPCRTTVHYLSDGAAGFAMPDSAYRYIARRADKVLYYDEMIFPLLGGSEAGVLRYLNMQQVAEDTTVVAIVGPTTSACAEQMALALGKSKAGGKPMITPSATHVEYQRRFAIEACYSGGLGEACEGLPGCLFITAANPYEASHADVWSEDVGVYLSNGFTRGFQEAIGTAPTISLRDLYYTLARNTSGSHVKIYNAPHYGSVYSNTMAEFLNNVKGNKNNSSSLAFRTFSP